MVNYPPYVDAYGKIKDVFDKIKHAAVPPKVTTDFIYSKLGLKSTSYRPMVPLLKKLGYINEAQVPTEAYRDYREEAKSTHIMAKQIRLSYNTLYSAHEYAHTLTKEEIVEKLISVLGASKTDKTVVKVAATFLALCDLADFDIDETPIIEETDEGTKTTTTKRDEHEFGITYTIVLNLPATTDGAVFDAIFKSLKEHLLK